MFNWSSAEKSFCPGADEERAEDTRQVSGLFPGAGWGGRRRAGPARGAARLKAKVTTCGEFTSGYKSSVLMTGKKP